MVENADVDDGSGGEELSGDSADVVETVVVEEPVVELEALDRSAVEQIAARSVIPGEAFGCGGTIRFTTFASNGGAFVPCLLYTSPSPRD